MADHLDAEGIDLGDEGVGPGDDSDIFDEPENVTVGALVPKGFPLKLAIGIAVLVLALLAFTDGKK